MKKLYVCLSVMLAAMLLCSACGLKNDLYLPDSNQAYEQVGETAQLS